MEYILRNLIPRRIPLQRKVVDGVEIAAGVPDGKVGLVRRRIRRRQDGDSGDGFQRDRS